MSFSRKRVMRLCNVAGEPKSAKPMASRTVMGCFFIPTQDHSFQQSVFIGIHLQTTRQGLNDLRQL